MAPVTAPEPAPVSAVPRRMRLVCAVAAGLLLLVMALVALTLPSSSTGVVAFGPVDQFAMVGLGAALGVGVLALGRSRVDADASGVRVLNIAVRHELPWSQVRAVAFDRRSSWATLQLTNGDEVAVLAVQAADKERAVRALEGLRALHAAARARERAQQPVRPPLLYDD